jgi:predicted acetyltransferase
MMQQQLHDIHERGEPIATLWASEGAIYGRFGYGLASVQAWIDIERDRGRFIADPGPSGRTRMLPLEGALKTIGPVYKRVQERTPGMFERTTAWWTHRQLADRKEWRDGGSPKYLAVWEDDEGRVRAYAFYQIRTGWSHAGPIGHVQLWELTAEDVVATREMWRFMFGIDLVDRVKSRFSMLPADTPLMLMLEEPRRLRADLTDALWVRVVDVKNALEGRRYAGDGEVVIELRDEMCAWNDGRWSITSSGGQATVEKTDSEPGLTMDAGGLGTAYLGTFSFAELERAGRIEVRSEEARRTADGMFRTDVAPFCQEIF